MTVLIDTRQAASLLGVSPETLRAWRVRGQGPAWHKLGKACRYARSDIDAFLAASRHRAGKSHSQRAPGLQTILGGQAHV